MDEPAPGYRCRSDRGLQRRHLQRHRRQRREDPQHRPRRTERLARDDGPEVLRPADPPGHPRPRLRLRRGRPRRAERPRQRQGHPVRDRHRHPRRRDDHGDPARRGARQAARGLVLRRRRSLRRQGPAVLHAALHDAREGRRRQQRLAARPPGRVHEGRHLDAPQPEGLPEGRAERHVRPHPRGGPGRDRDPAAEDLDDPYCWGRRRG